MYTGTLVEFLNMGGGEIMMILAVVLLLFGGKKLPELARGLGKGIRDFKDASEGVKREIHRNINAMDIDDELRAESVAGTAETSHGTTDALEDQMYPKNEVIEPINLNKETVSPEHTDDTTVPAEKLETEKNKPN